MISLPDLFIPKKKHFGLAIGRTSLRAVEVDEKGKVRTFIEEILPADAFTDGILLKKELFIQLLKKILTASKFTTSYVAVCFSEAHAYSRECVLPKVSADEIDEAIQWQVKDLFPFPQEEIYYNWKVLDETENLRTVVVAVPKKVLDPLVDALIVAGLKPLSFEPGSSVIARMLKLKPEEQAILTEINRQGAYVTLVEGEKALFTTIINYSADDSNQSYIANINQSINELISYYEKKKILRKSTVKIILTGELTTEDIARRIMAEINLPVNILGSMIGKPSFNKAYTLALFPVTPPEDPLTINLLPTQIQKKYNSEIQQNLYKSLFIRANFVLIFLCIMSLSVFIFMRIEQQSLSKKVEVLSQKVKSQQSTETKSLLLLNSQAANIVSYSPLRKTPKDKLLIIESLITDSITLTEWSFDDGKQAFTLNGHASDRNELLAFKEKLEESGEFTKVSLPLGSLETPENIRFSINFIIAK